MGCKIHRLLLAAAIFLIYSTVTMVTSFKILLLPMPHGAHVNFFCSAGSTLKAAGHDVYIITSPRFSKLATDYGINTLLPKLTEEPIILDDNIFKQKPGAITQGLRAPKLLKAYVQDIVKDTALIRKTESLYFDLVLIDNMDAGRYLYLIPYKLSIPYITLAARPDPWASRVSALPSVEGTFPFNVLTEDSNIIHRAVNTGMYLFIMALTQFLKDDSLLTDLVPEKENVGFNELYLRSEMVLVNLDIICLDTPRVSSPYYQYIGGIAAKPAKPLPDDIEEFVSSAKDGVIVVSFGSALKNVPDHMLTKMVTAFGRIKQHVIMRHNGDVPKDMPKTVFLSKWLPQNDLLGHKNTKLFITHAGNSGQLEAVYHGVPMVSMPLALDQHYDARRAEVRSYGVTLDPDSFSAEELVDAVTELTENSTYYDNIQKCSIILKHLPSAQETILFWVEHVIKFGGSHLKPYYLRMPLWKFLLLDVMLMFLLTFIILVCFFRYCCTKCCYKKKLHQKVE